MTKEELLNFNNMRGIFEYQKKNYFEALNIFNVMIRDNQYNSATVCYLYLILGSLKKKKEGLKLLEKEADQLNSVVLYQHLAIGLWKTGQDLKAIQIYEDKLLKMRPWSRKLMIEYARMLKSYDKSKMIDACKQILNRSSYPLPDSKEAFFYDGYANYLLGKHERARYDFERSNGFYPDYYDRIPE